MRILRLYTRLPPMQGGMENHIANLTKEQIDAINFTHETLRDALSMLTECHDLYLSDINKLNDAFWKLKHQFNLGNNND